MKGWTWVELHLYPVLCLRTLSKLRHKGVGTPQRALVGCKEKADVGIWVYRGIWDLCKQGPRRRDLYRERTPEILEVLSGLFSQTLSCVCTKKDSGMPDREQILGCWQQNWNPKSDTVLGNTGVLASQSGKTSWTTQPLKWNPRNIMPYEWSCSASIVRVILDSS